jgi:hypothetical protein
MQRKAEYTYADFMAALEKIGEQYGILRDDLQMFMMDNLFKMLQMSLNPAMRYYIRNHHFTWSHAHSAFVIKAYPHIPMGELEIYLGIPPDINITRDVYSVSPEMMRDKIIPNLVQYLEKQPQDEFHYYLARAASYNFQESVLLLLTTLEPFQNRIMHPGGLSLYSFVSDQMAILSVIANDMLANMDNMRGSVSAALPFASLGKIREAVQQNVIIFKDRTGMQAYRTKPEFTQFYSQYLMVDTALRKCEQAMKALNKYTYVRYPFFSRSTRTQIDVPADLPKSKL